jgi:hypothetical protein
MGRFKSRATKVFRVFLSLVLAATMVSLLSACGVIQERLIREEITKELDLVKLNSSQVSSTFFSNATISSNYNLTGAGMAKLAEEYFPGFDYTIDKISINSSKATVSVTLTCKALADISDTFQGIIYDCISGDKTIDLSKSTFGESIEAFYLSAAKDTPSKQVSVDLPFVRNGVNWEPGPDFIEELGNALIGDHNYDEDQILVDVFAGFEVIKQADKGTLEPYANLFADETDYSELGITGLDFALAWLEGFDYEISGISENGKGATVLVSVKCKQLLDIAELFDEKTLEFFNGSEAVRLSRQDRNLRVGELLMEAADNTSSKITRIKLSFTKSSSAWLHDDINQREIYRAIIGKEEPIEYEAYV